MKIERAAELLTELDQKASAFFGSKPFLIHSQVDGSSGDRIFVVEVRQEPPLSLSVIAGEVVHELRSSLDHLVWQLVIANGNTPDRDTEFPVFSDDERYRRARKKKIRGMSASAQQRIDELQPFVAGDRFQDHALFVVHELDRQDKHQSLNVIGGAFQKRHAKLGGSGAGTVWFEGPAIYSPSLISVYDGVELLRVRSTSEFQVDVEVEFEFAMALDESAPGGRRPAVPLLGDLVRFVLADVESFSGEFTAAAFVG